MAGTGGSTLPFGPGSSLWKYWHSKVPEYLSKPHPWTALHRDILRALLKNGVANAEHIAQGLTTNLIQSVDPTYFKRRGKK